MKILVTGGAGYIGSHTCVCLHEAGFDFVIFDNFSNAFPDSIQRLEKIIGKSVDWVDGDIRDQEKLRSVFRQFSIDAVIHFAGLKAVGESIVKPLLYYDNNVSGTVSLCDVMQEFSCHRLIFSSSATVYGQPKVLPITEEESLKPTNPYGRSKFMVEEILRDLFVADPKWSVILLRYFNPVGAHPSGLIGENPKDKPNNLMPLVSQVAGGVREFLEVFGQDYATPDGSGIRDYIHVMDLAQGHVAAIKQLLQPQVLTLNLGTGRGHSVLDLIRMFEKVAGVPIAYKVTNRRAGDIGVCYADTQKANHILNWRACRDLESMCVDAWNWQKNLAPL